VATLRGGHGRLHAGGPATGDQHPAGASHGRNRAKLQLAPCGWVLNAGDGIARVVVADTGLVAGDAGADVLWPAAFALFAISGSEIIARVMPHMSA
jgi:hypothetical protein